MRKRDSVSNLTYRRRQEHRTRGLQYYREKRGSAARDAFVRSIDVTPSMAYELIKILRAQGIPCLLYTSPSPRDKRQSRMPSSA